MDVRERAQRAKAASRILARQSRARKDAALQRIAEGLLAERDAIEQANEADVRQAETGGLSSVLVERLALGAERITALARAVEHIATLPDPVGSRSAMTRSASGLLIGKQRLPLGLVAIVYESRPNVTVDAAALTLKSGNAVLLRGGKEAARTNAALVEIMRRALRERDLPEDAICLVPPGDREEIKQLVSLSDLVDLAIPRGGEGLIRFVADVARVPVIKHYKGVCHLFLDESAELDMALALTVNGKVQRPGVCNALECLLVHQHAAERLLPPIAAALVREGVELRGCERSRALVPSLGRATDADWGTEFLAKILAIRVVDDVDGALLHVERYGSNHSEAICTNRLDHAERWLAEVDASCVLVNASTRFNDGGELGLGAEMGISTSKLHAYGPMGLESLTAEKWIVLGEGQVRA
ncbi:MAG: glutamate-5-semialdehyde dehydrogenase [Polyangiaceae bacterium]|nr:glutamate-5-semialdehyde dehydrogenase [Polyangiaceae bacterium]